MIVVGVTGKYCAGKDTATSILREAGYHEIDVDSLGHLALEQNRESLLQKFGATIAGPDGQVDRKKLGAMVFADRNRLRTLESIVHPAMVEMVRLRIETHRTAAPHNSSGDSDPPGIVVNAAVLCRMGLDSLCDTVIYVYAPVCVRFLRARRRDGATLSSVIRRLSSQRDVSPQFCSENADIHSVRNGGSQAHLRARLSRFVPLP